MDNQKQTPPARPDHTSAEHGRRERDVGRTDEWRSFGGSGASRGDDVGPYGRGDGYGRRRMDYGGSYGAESYGRAYARDPDYGGRPPFSRSGSSGDGARDRDRLDRTGDKIAGIFRSDDDQPAGHRGHGPKGYRRSDERISDEVNERLTDDQLLDAREIEVSVADGEVTLTGTVALRPAKHRAEWLVEQCSGVSHVQNNLRVREPGALGQEGVDLEANPRVSRVSSGEEP